MRDIDRRAIEGLGVPSLALMENAAKAVVSVILSKAKERLEGKNVIICGKGNNGGDGLAIARLLLERGARPVVCLLSREAELSGDAAAQLGLARRAGVPIQEAHGSMEPVKVALEGARLVVDAILGTGTRGAVTGFLAEVIEAVNGSSAFVVAVDIPSGLSGESLAPTGPAVHADITVTLGFGKPVLFTPEGAPFCGDVVVKEIGIPEIASRDIAPAAIALDEQWAHPFFVPRSPTAHKGSCGRVLLVAGSAGKAGAAALAARGALRAGAGLVTVAIPEPAQGALSPLPETMTLPLPATQEGTLSMNALVPLLDFASQAEAVGIGPGLGSLPETAALIRELYARLPFPMAVDADALNAFAGNEEALCRHAGARLLTPHPGEMGRLAGLGAAEVLASRYALVPDKAALWNSVILLKGFRTLVSDGREPWRINLSGGPHLAGPGMGDVLTGIVTTLLARGMSPLDAASLGAWWHGSAGDEAFARLGGYGLLASEVADALPVIEGRLRTRGMGTRDKPG
jgi:NAD(P)H-hydrate epimerase